MATKLKEELLRRKKELQDKLRELAPLQEELAEVETLLAAYNRHGREAAGHEPGCRCRECDPSW